MFVSHIHAQSMPRESRLARAIYFGCLFVFLSSLGGWAFMAHNDSPVARRLQAQERSSLADQQFAWSAAQTGMAEIKLSELASTRGLSSAVRELGRQIVMEYTNATNHLRDLTSQDSIALPADISPEYQDRYKRLSHLNGHDFDKAYVEAIVQLHQESLPLLQNEAKSGRSQNIKSYALEAISVSREQLEKAQQTLRSVSP
jgi:putative membrane protein